MNTQNKGHEFRHKKGDLWICIYCDEPYGTIKECTRRRDTEEKKGICGLNNCGQHSKGTPHNPFISCGEGS